MTQKQLRKHVRASYVKVAEYQRRGLVHVHVVIRLDRAMPDYRARPGPTAAARFTRELLEHAVRAAVADVRAPLPDELGGGTVALGHRARRPPPRRRHERREVAGYLAKYATKSTEQAGSVLSPRSPRPPSTRCPVREHVRAYLRAAFELAADPALADRRVRRRARTRSATAATA